MGGRRPQCRVQQGGGGEADPAVSSLSGQEDGDPVISNIASGGGVVGRRGEAFAATYLELRILGRAIHTDRRGIGLEIRVETQEATWVE